MLIEDGVEIADPSDEDGNIGVIQTMVSELVHKPEHERKSQAVPRRKNS